jgi:hypothetical protein
MPALVARLGTNHSRRRLATMRWTGVPWISPDCIRETNWKRRTDLMWISLFY